MTPDDTLPEIPDAFIDTVEPTLEADSYTRYHHGAPPSRERLGDRLVRRGIITVQQLKAAIGNTDQGDERLATLSGGMPKSADPAEDLREQIKRAFNTDPAKHPLRILVATDAAREGVNLQNHCADLFHMDLPWNPSRLEQRNGRIDRKLQKSDVVRCHYFLLPQRPEDRVLETLVRKTATTGTPR